MEEKVTVSLSQNQILELKEIILDSNKEAAFEFLKENIYREVNKPKGTGCKPEF
jgi:hypothetical protein